MRRPAPWLARAALLGALLSLPLAAQPAAPSPNISNPGAIVYPGTAGVSPGAFSKDMAGGGSVWPVVFIVLCAGAGSWLWWRNRRGSASLASRGERQLSIAETRPLGNRQYLVVAAYQDRKFLLGVCPGRIELLTPLDAKAPVPPR
jgi:flagellar protein FliO/FliZ